METSVINSLHIKKILNTSLKLWELSSSLIYTWYEPLLLTAFIYANNNNNNKIKFMKNKKFLINWTIEHNVEEDKTAGRGRNAFMDNLIAPYV